MFLVLIVLASSPILGAVVEDRIDSCSASEFACNDSGCISMGLVCDGRSQCADGSDEAACGVSSGSFLYDTILHRSKRQTKCGSLEWPCRDGQCISFDEKCDGVKNCQDGSDETHALCRNVKCQPNWFQCTYGACADGTAPCNGVRECADGSDELLPRCRNSTDVRNGKFYCQDGGTISATSLCDGVSDCADGSDETVRACTAISCPSHLFRCAYGACVDRGADCNGITECADGSDEAEELCPDRIFTGTVTTTTPSPDQTSNQCKLPPYPEHGTYTMMNNPGAKPGDSFPSLVIQLSCDPGYILVGDTGIICSSGTWSQPLDDFPKCLRYCTLKKDPSVKYRCPGVGETSECQTQVPAGTRVVAECNSPNYYSTTPLPIITCTDGYWSSMPVCTPECGRVTPTGQILVINGTSAKLGELPWHATIYSRDSTPYLQICGGSLISTTVVISAAHCFWNDNTKEITPASHFFVGVGKIYRPWNETHDTAAQLSDVRNIHVPSRFRGASQNWQADIAVMVMQREFEYTINVRPICFDFDSNFDRRQLINGKKGKVAGFGLTSEDGFASQVLKVTELPYVDIEQCTAIAQQFQPAFVEYITFDKICAGYLTNITALCRGDSGGGLAFPDVQRGISRYYLRGVVSTAPSNENLCNSNTFSTFTHIIKHDEFIRNFIS